MREGAVLLAERGVDGFSMREVARRAGVAVAAPSHHFGNARGLLTAIAAEGFERLVERQATAVESHQDPVERLVALCGAYVAMRVVDPGAAAVMFRLDLVDEADARFRQAAFRAFDQLQDALARAAPAPRSDQAIALSAKALWATMHGLQTLKMIDASEVDAIVRLAVGRLVP